MEAEARVSRPRGAAPRPSDGPPLCAEGEADRACACPRTVPTKSPRRNQTARAATAAAAGEPDRNGASQGCRRIKPERGRLLPAPAQAGRPQQAAVRRWGCPGSRQTPYVYTENHDTPLTPAAPPPPPDTLWTDLEDTGPSGHRAARPTAPELTQKGPVLPSPVERIYLSSTSLTPSFKFHFYSK